MPTLTATVGGSTANTYLTVAAASTLLNQRLGNSDWDVAATDDKERALIQATEDIDALRFDGLKLTASQALAFPRSNQEEPFDQVPLAVRRACAYQALGLLRNASTGGRSEQQSRDRAGVVSYTIGNLSETFASARSQSDSAWTDLYPEARKALQDWVSRTGHIIGARERPIAELGEGWGPWR